MCGVILVILSLKLRVRLSLCVTLPELWTFLGFKVLIPNSITLSGHKQVRSWSQTCSELKFGLSSSLLAAN